MELRLASPRTPAITMRHLKRELAQGRLTPDQVDDELRVVQLHLEYHRARQMQLEQEQRDITRAYQQRMKELDEERGRTQQSIDELVTVRKRLYDRHYHNERKKEHGREHSPENPESIGAAEENRA